MTTAGEPSPDEPSADAGGTYTLVVTLREPVTATVGALGEVTLPAGGYAYTGSAQGAGGFSRIDRHRRLAAGESDTRHWHVDYLLGHPATTLSDVVRTHGRDVECAVAEQLGAGPVPGFGASDCDCESHLTHRYAPSRLAAAARDAHDAV